jgi:hypothetical protein
VSSDLDWRDLRTRMVPNASNDDTRPNRLDAVRVGATLQPPSSDESPAPGF